MLDYCVFRFLAIVTLLGLLLFQPATAQLPESVRLNEIMSSNSATIADEDGDFEDWIELYNAGTSAVNLEGFGLSDNYAQPFKWVLPAITLNAGEYLLIWASGKNRVAPDAPLHTNYGISAAGEEVLLTHPDGTRLDSLPAIAIPTDVSIGRKPDGTSDWYFFTEPTPGAANTTPGYQEFLNPPTFSHDSGFYDGPFTLQISHPDPDVTIIYTLDGSRPNPDNIAGTAYRYRTGYEERPGDEPGTFVERSFKSFVLDRENNEIQVEDRTPQPNGVSMIPTTWHNQPFYLPQYPVRKITLVRAIAVKPGTLASATAAGTYIVLPEVAQNYPYAVVSVSANEDELFDYDRGIMVAGVDFDSWRAENPTSRAGGSSPGNYRRAGDEAEVHGRVTFFETPQQNRRIALDQDAGIRMHGWWGRSYPNKSLRLYARARYGDSEFRHPLFENRPHSSYKRFMLRNSGQDYAYTMLRDAYLQSLVRHMQFDTQSYRPVTLFLNGEYWGLYNLRERYDKHFLERVYGVDPDNIDLMEGYLVTKEGDNVHYFNMLQYIEQHDMANSEHFEHASTLMDMENFRDYNIAQIFIRNMDWPGSNIDYWRVRTEQYEPNRPYGHDGRWRWMLYDTDAAFGLYDPLNTASHNTLAFATVAGGEDWPNPDWATFLLRNMLLNDGFRKDFINRFADQLNTAFAPEHSLSLLQQMADAIEPLMPAHIDRWQRPWNFGFWQQEISNMAVFAEQRPGFVWSHIQNHFDLAEPAVISVNVSNAEAGWVRVNSVDLTDTTPGLATEIYPWQGRYFPGVPITLMAMEKDGYRFKHWLINDGNNSVVEQRNLILNPASGMSVTAVFEPQQPVDITDLQLVHYFMFRNILNDTPLQQINSVYSADGLGGASIQFMSSLAGYPFNADHPDWRKGSMERRNQPTPINYRPEGNQGLAYDLISSIRSMQVRQPFAVGDRENTLIFHLPTNGFESAVLSFAAMDENAGAFGLHIDYAAGFDIVNVTGGAADTIFAWTTAGLADGDRFKSLATGVYQLYTVDFSAIAEVANNPDFRVRIRFDVRDGSLANGDRVTFNNIALDGSAIPVSVPLASSLPDQFELGQNYPNPFNPTTTIPFALSESAPVRLEVYNLVGQRVAVLRDEIMPAGWHQVRFDASSLASGVYVYRLQTSGFVQTRKLLLIR
jgi:hypothetical protein